MAVILLILIVMSLGIINVACFSAGIFESIFILLVDILIIGTILGAK